MIYIIILLITNILFLIYIYLLKKDIKNIIKTIVKIKTVNTNQTPVTSTFDKDLSQLLLLVNDILDKQKNISIKNNQNNRKLRQALTNISHDLRTPLTSATGYIQLIQSPKTPAGKKDEYLNIVTAKLHSLSVLMDELFTFTQIVEGNTQLDIEKINLCNILRDCISLFYNDFVEKDITADIIIPDTPVYIMGDYKALNRVFQNLIKNVLQHGSNYFKLYIKADSSAIYMENAVPNAEALDSSLIFERFYTIDLSRTFKSTGLGLAITKELIEHMDGTIHADLKENLMIFTIQLPPYK